MLLIETGSVATAALPVAELRDHLRLGTGFADIGALDAMLEACLRAAIGAIEGRTAKALLSRDFRLTLDAWRGGTEGQPLPLAPVSAVRALSLEDAAGTTHPVDPDTYRLAADLARPRLIGCGAAGLPAIPADGRAVIEFTAGFGPDWPSVPVDLRQAVMLLAAQYYELRHEGVDETGAMPFGVLALIERWRTVRVLGGGA